MDDLLKDAIADAKAVRETALANAKLALEEAFTPRIQSMLSQKIQSEIEDEDEVADADEMSHEGEDHDEEEAPEAPEAPEAEAPEVAVEPEEGEEVADIADEIEDEDEMAHEGEHEDEDEGYDESKVIEIDGVKYAPVVSEEEEDEDEAMHEEEDEDEGYSEDLDLEAVLAELEGETVTEEEEEEEKDEVKEEEDKDEEEEVNENDVSSDIGAADNKLKPEAGDSSKIGQGPEGEGSDKPAGKEDENSEIVDDLKEDIEVTEDIDLEEVLKALTEEEDEEDEAVEESVNEVKTLKADLEEHRNVVKYLRGKLNEVNLLNAKLLFTNKLFRNFGLNNEQKLKVVETFDRATNLREVKLVFSTLAESFGNKVASKPSKKQESKGSASKAVASTKPKTEEVISEGFDMKARFQKLAKIL
tara:strand:- start:906 stop:2153 length:1248 start_codon:yes stop_codon:yes gene_type:complete